MRALFRVMSSLELTVLLLGFSGLLVFFGTLDQVHYGIHLVQKRYFASFLAFWQYPLQWPGGEALYWLRLPLPGGYLLGILLLINLLSAHFRFFRPTWKKTGIVLIHSGVLLLIVSGFVSGVFQKESLMWIDEGGRSNYSEDYNSNELVLIDTTASDWDEVFSVPFAQLESGEAFTHPQLPFRIEPLYVFENALLASRKQNPQAPPNPTTRGVGLDLAVFPRPPTYKENEANRATAYIRLTGNEGSDLGVWLVSNVLDERFPPQAFDHAGRSYTLALRFKRHYHPFWLELEDFSYDRYPGTEIPRNFSSQVTILNPERSEERQVLISMNHPLRYAGLTFFQASFDELTEKASALMVVRNPGWSLPYVAIVLLGVGMLVQFTMHLYLYLQKRVQPTSSHRQNEEGLKTRVSNTLKV